MDFLKKENIDTRPFFHPLSSLPAYKNSSTIELAMTRNYHSYQISQHGINLPSGMNIDRSKVTYICEKIKEHLDIS